MRGKGYADSNDYQRFGITPAYAGKRRRGNRGLCKIRDHPRVCGEKTPTFSTSARTMGSPPRMRGKVALPIDCAATVGITPAYAGKREPGCDNMSPVRDHPRVCGEKGSAVRVIYGKLGSPPRMRGKASAAVPAGRFAGITPAYAGKSARDENRKNAARDHPRVCGEKGIIS